MCYTIAKDLPRVGKARVAACITYKGRLVSIGVNSSKSNPLAKHYGHNEHAIYTHAELAAIKNALKTVELDKLQYCVLYIGRAKLIDNQWQTGLAKPCIGCQRAIAEFGIKHVEWTL